MIKIGFMFEHSKLEHRNFSDSQFDIQIFA